MLERGDDVLAEARGEHVLLRAELVPRLPDDGVDDVQARDFVLRFALLGRKVGGYFNNSGSLFVVKSQYLQYHYYYNLKYIEHYLHCRYLITGSSFLLFMVSVGEDKPSV